MRARIELRPDVGMHRTRDLVAPDHQDRDHVQHRQADADDKPQTPDHIRGHACGVSARGQSDHAQDHATEQDAKP